MGRATAVRRCLRSEGFGILVVFLSLALRYAARLGAKTTPILVGGFAWTLISIFAFAWFASRRFYVAWKEVAKEVGEGSSTSDLAPILNAARAQFYAVMLATSTG